MPLNKYDVIIVGAGAAGLIATAQASKRGKKVLLLEGSAKIGAKIKISGGGRCNFTNKSVSAHNYLSNNPHFVKSALARYSPQDFIKLVEHYKISYHEKTLGQLFCDGPSQQIIDMLINECQDAAMILDCQIDDISKNTDFIVTSNKGIFSATSLIIATGGLSIPKLGATDFAYRIAQKFDLTIVQTRPALVPLLYQSTTGLNPENLAGIAIPAIAKKNNIEFKESILFTHRGLSGPAILQISSYLNIPDTITLNLLPNINIDFATTPNSNISTVLKQHFANRFVDQWFVQNFTDKKISQTKQIELTRIINQLEHFAFTITGSEGYAKAEVTAGGIDTKELSSKTMEAIKVKNLYFIGECVDVTGWLGGYNFQWAWSSGFIAGTNA